MKSRLNQQESIVKRYRGTNAFYDTGTALGTINRERLYKKGYKTFESYCIDRLDMKSRSAYQLIKAAQVVDNVRNCAQFLPANEAQARPLTKVPPEQQPEVWCYIVDHAPNGKITAKFIEKVVKQFLGKKTHKREAKSDGLLDLILQVFSICQKIDEKSKLIHQKHKFLEILVNCEKRMQDQPEFLTDIDQAFLTFPHGANPNLMIQFWMSWKDDKSHKKDNKRKSGSGRHYKSPPPLDDFDPYQILGVGPGATLYEIKKAYRKSVKMFHPDTLGRLDIDESHQWIRKEGENRMKSVNKAYEKVRK